MGKFHLLPNAPCTTDVQSSSFAADSSNSPSKQSTLSFIYSSTVGPMGVILCKSGLNEIIKNA